MVYCSLIIKLMLLELKLLFFKKITQLFGLSELMPPNSKKPSIEGQFDPVVVDVLRKQFRAVRRPTSRIEFGGGMYVYSQLHACAQAESVRSSLHAHMPRYKTQFGAGRRRCIRGDRCW